MKCCQRKSSDEEELKGVSWLDISVTVTIMSSQLQASSFSVELQDWAESTTSGQSKGGKFLMVVIFICNVIAMIVYVIDTARTLVEECLGWDQIVTLQIDFALGLVFLLYFIIRVMAEENLFKVIFTVDTIIDLLTLPPLFFSIFYERTWIGLRFFRFLYIINLPDVLVYIRVLTNSNSIRLSQVKLILFRGSFPI